MYRSPSAPSFSAPSVVALNQTPSISSDGTNNSNSNSTNDEECGTHRLCSTGISHNLGRLDCNSSSAAPSPSVSCVTPLSTSRSLRGSSSSSSRRLRASRLAASSGPPRPNPFDSMLNSESLKLPVLSPSVFATVESPSQQMSSSDGRFWSVEQQASLFPASISEDSPWKQADATSVLDPETENRTQEAIETYFSQHHQIQSPELNNSNSMMVDAAHSTAAILGDAIEEEEEKENNSAVTHTRHQKQPLADSSRNVSRVESFTVAQGRQPSSASSRHTQWTQTTLALPPVLPPDIEQMLQSYFTFDERQDEQLPPPPQRGAGTGGTDTPLEEMQPGNLSTSTLRRKLFEGMIDDDNSSSSEDAEEEAPLDIVQQQRDEGKENHAQQNNIMSSPIQQRQEAPSSEGEEQRSTGCRFSSPTQALTITPISKVSRIAGRNPKWSSSPISAKMSRRMSVTPPFNMASPTFSPVFSSTNEKDSRTHNQS